MRRHASLELKRAAPTFQPGRKSLQYSEAPKGRLSAEMIRQRKSAEMMRSSMDSQAATFSRSSSVATVTVQKGEAKGTCPRFHPLFSITIGAAPIKCSLCGNRSVSMNIYSCTICNYHKCEHCAAGIVRRKQKKASTAPKKKKASCFASFACYIFRENEPQSSKTDDNVSKSTFESAVERDEIIISDDVRHDSVDESPASTRDGRYDV